MANRFQTQFRINQTDYRVPMRGGTVFIVMWLLALMTACSTPSVTPEFSTKGLVKPSTQCVVDPRQLGDVKKLQSFSKPNGCGIPNPYLVKSVAGVAFSTPAKVNCGVVTAMDHWVKNIAQPAAASRFGEKVVAVKIAASYACRPRNNRRGAKLSEHGFGNAIDISSFTLASGREVTVKHGWNGSSDERGFLRDVDKASCGTFSTVLSPRANRAHHDHFHFDLQKHGRSGTYLYCR